MTGVYHIQKRRNIFSGMSVNFTLVLINVVLFILFSILISKSQSYINFIAIKPSNILQGNYLWTIITSMFMHGGFFHLFVNMLTLFFIGGFVERLLGSKRYFWFYMASGIFAALAFVALSLVFVSDFNAYAVGASGALFGIIGLLMVLTPNLPVMIMFIPIPVKMKYAAPGILVVLWIISIAGNVPIGNVAHLGGFALGIVYGFYLKKKYKKKTEHISRLFS